VIYLASVKIGGPEVVVRRSARARSNRGSKSLGMLQKPFPKPAKSMRRRCVQAAHFTLRPGGGGFRVWEKGLQVMARGS